MIFMLIYLLIISYAYGLFFNKKFYESLAPSIILHGLITLISWFIFNDLRIGCYFYIFVSLAYIIFKTFSTISKNEKLDIGWFKDKTFAIFIILFVVLCTINQGRRFFHWDEYGHWGMFIKETFRLNKYFSVSRIPYAHKDYVSFTTIIMYNFLKVARKFEESFCFTAMTTFLFSMILPIFSYIKFETQKLISKTNIKSIIFMVFVFSVPYLFPYAPFFISILADAALGTALFYCLYVVCTQTEGNDKYYLFLSTLSLTSLALVKMDGFAFIPGVLLFMFLLGYRKPLSYITPVTVSLTVWACLNIYITKYAYNPGIQGYGGVKATDILDVITLNTQRIPYIKEVLNNYLDYLVNNKCFLGISYVTSGLIVLFVIFSLALISKEKEIVTWGIGIFLAYIYRILLMFFLYATRFPKEEAIALASYDRYMSSFLIGMHFFAAFVIIKCYYNIKCKSLVSMFIALYICFVSYISYSVIRNIDFKNNSYSKTLEVVAMFQYCPGFIANKLRYGLYDNDTYDKVSTELEELYKQNNKVALIMASDNIQKTILQYYVDGYPLDIIFLGNQSNEELAQKLTLYDYLFTISDAKIISERSSAVMSAIDNQKLENLQIIPISKH